MMRALEGPIRKTSMAERILQCDICSDHSMREEQNAIEEALLLRILDPLFFVAIYLLHILRFYVSMS